MSQGQEFVGNLFSDTDMSEFNSATSAASNAAIEEEESLNLVGEETTKAADVIKKVGEAEQAKKGPLLFDDEEVSLGEGHSDDEGKDFRASSGDSDPSLMVGRGVEFDLADYPGITTPQEAIDTLLRALESGGVIGSFEESGGKFKITPTSRSSSLVDSYESATSGSDPAGATGPAHKRLTPNPFLSLSLNKTPTPPPEKKTGAIPKIKKPTLHEVTSSDLINAGIIGAVTRSKSAIIPRKEPPQDCPPTEAKHKSYVYYTTFGERVTLKTEDYCVTCDGSTRSSRIAWYTHLKIKHPNQLIDELQLNK